MVVLNRVAKTYHIGEVEVRALQEVSFSIATGEFAAIMGPSGSGKSTLLNIIGCLTNPTDGEYHLNGRAVGQADSGTLADIRNHTIGFIFQQFHLLQRLTAWQNVEIPMIYAGVPRLERLARAREMLEHVGLGKRLHHFPSQLSGGEQQRVAIARSIVNRPKLLLADEPTGNLDSHVGQEIIERLIQLNKDGMTILLVTHYDPFKELVDRVIHMRDGAMVS